ncbi:FkbM family methyltransferase [Hymenobacter sp. BT188]|uniref:FkbM family methyltransferase n=1 Tax=Hymenobacter sp. BT188 TaxID=2763504 RepID=UPI001651A1FA|nr:FkbM family methyltransferase [Hymenobacter sp. BT188]MBC6608397.1 FkbM family methyltransferase [Hymenobacter sp. BT188]
MAKRILKRIPIAFTKNQQYDRDTERVLRAVCHSQANCVDVGCHKGEVLELMLKYAPQGQHYGFEPIPDLYEKLTTHFADYANCHFYQLGLSNMTGETSFNYVLTNPAYSGFVKRKYDKADEVDTLIKVKKQPLDQILPPGTRIDLIKIDVEGAELEVLQGAAKTIQHSRPAIIFEHGLGASDCYGTRPEQIFELLTGAGNLHVSTMARWLAGQPSFTRAEFVEQFEKSLNYYFMAYPEEKTRKSNGQVAE